MADFVKNYSINELKNYFQNINEPQYRAVQLFQDLYIRRIKSFDECTTFSKNLRNKLSQDYLIDSLKILRKKESKDGSIKFLLELIDNLKIESVVLDSFNENAKTLCISSQVGCPMKCSFCATGQLGFYRNLSVAEIADQFLLLGNEISQRISNIVFMGMGEPLLNLDNVIKAIKNITYFPQDIISSRKITISTIGIPDKIKEMADTGLKLKLALSLHSAFEDKRELIIPSSKNWTMKSILDSLEYYYKKVKMPITFEYILFENFNDSKDDINQIAILTRKFPSKVNLIEYHNISFAVSDYKYNLNLKSADSSKIIWFAKELRTRGIDTFIRKSYGKDIEAACGQLALAYYNNY